MTLIGTVVIAWAFGQVKKSESYGCDSPTCADNIGASRSGIGLRGI